MRHLAFLLVLVACGSHGETDIDGSTGGGGDGSGSQTDGASAQARTIFVIPLENKPSSQIYTNMQDAPYINGLLATSATASKFTDELPSLDSEPHYVWMEAGTNAFSDVTINNDDDPSASHSTASTDHLVNQLEAAGLAWMSYQEDIVASTCPITTVAAYAPKHDPFVFFKDVAGNTPSPSAARCVTHHKPYSAFAADLQAGLTGYIFITPNLCNDMHGDLSCLSTLSTSGAIKAGDAWLKKELPRIIEYTQSHDALILLTWDEGDSSNLLPFVMIGKHVKPGVSTVAYSHSSQLKSIEEWFRVPVLPTVASANDFADMFEPGTFP